MPEDESTVNPPGWTTIPSAGSESEPAPGSVPFGTPFAPEPGTETPFTAGGSENEGVAAEVPFSEVPTEEPGSRDDAPVANSASVGGGAPANQAGLSTPPPSGRGLAATLGKPSDDDRLMAALAWISMLIFQIPLVSIVMLMSENSRNRPFQRYHAMTSLLLWLGAVVYEILAVFSYTILGVVTLGCGFLCLWPILLVPYALGALVRHPGLPGTLPRGAGRVPVRTLSELGLAAGRTASGGLWVTNAG